MKITSLIISFLIISCSVNAAQKVLVGADKLFTEEYADLIKNKNIGLITNHTAVNKNLRTTCDLLKENASKYKFRLMALFAPEHGISGIFYSEDHVEDELDPDGIPIYSLHGKTQRPTDKMLKPINLLIYDIQDIGARSYTYITTLFYVMEEAAKRKIPVIVLDRPNPINGITVDGPMLEEQWRSIVGYINVPYCHGMTIAELAQFFNAEYKIGCKLHVVPMEGWKRQMTFQDTGLTWIPTSPHIPEASTAFYYPVTGILGELQLISIGVGYTLPFKVVGAPWIDAKRFAKMLNDQKFPGVHFLPFYFCPFYGRFARENCQGVQIVVTDPLKFKPVSTQYLIIGMLKTAYPKQFKKALAASVSRKNMFCKVNGTEAIYNALSGSGSIVWKLRGVHEKERNAFMALRKKYLISSY
jgi:uncharacterized protein YbbC (DUF1343 family)